MRIENDVGNDSRLGERHVLCGPFHAKGQGLSIFVRKTFRGTCKLLSARDD